MNPETRFSAQWIVGAQGSGKSNLLLHMLSRDLKRDAAIIIMDPKGDISGPIRNLNLDALHLNLYNRLVVLDPHQPFAINPLDVPKTDVKRAVNHLEYIFGALLEANVTPKQKSLLRSILRAIVIGFPDPTLQTVQDIINNGLDGYRQYIQKLPPDLQDFFNKEWKDYDATRNELKWRIRLVMENDLIRRMFSAPRTRFNIAESMDRGDVVVIDNSIEHLHEDGSAFLGRFFLAQIWAAAMARQSRPRSEKKPVYVYIDECHQVIKRDATIAQIIDTCRSQNIALILSHQRTKQIEEPNVLSALENCAIKMANVDAEASYFSKLLHIPEERINLLPTGTFAMHVRGEGSSIVQVPLAKLPYPQMTETARANHTEWMEWLYGIEAKKPPEDGNCGVPATPKSPQGNGGATQKAPGGAHSVRKAVKPIIAEKKVDPSAPSKWSPR